MKRGAGIRGAGIRGFAVIVVLKAGSSPPSFGVPALACLDLPLSDGGSRGVVAGVSARVGIFMGCEDRNFLGSTVSFNRGERAPTLADPRDVPLTNGGWRGVVEGGRKRDGIFLGVVEGIPLGIFLDGGVFLLTIFFTLALDAVRDCQTLLFGLSGLDFGLQIGPKC